MTANGLLLLDVDGPLNPCDAKALRVWLNPDHGPMLLDLAADTGLELVWATTWGALANTYIGPTIGLPQLPVIPFGPPDWTAAGWALAGSWKWRSVAEYAAGRPVAWLDDELYSKTYRQAKSKFDYGRAGTPTFLCHIDPQVGLLPEDLDAVRTWVAGHKTLNRIYDPTAK